jgi:hypothetical protein
VITGECKRSPNLILDMSIYLREVQPGRLVAVMGVDFGGNTDPAWAMTTGAQPAAYDESRVPRIFCEFQAFSRAACQRRWSLMKVEMK